MFENSAETLHLSDLIPGYDPLIYKGNGEYLNQDGELIKPGFLVGEDEWHRELFIEYERTFGRGHAFDITHKLVKPYLVGTESEIVFIDTYGDGVIEEYNRISGTAPTLMNRGTKEEAEKMIGQMREYRKKHSALYKDYLPVVRHKKKFSIQK